MPMSINNENGSVMLFTLMFTLIMTVMGLIATQTSIFEIKIAENARRYNEELAGAETALNHAIANFRKLKDDPGQAATEANTTDIAKVLNDTKYSEFQAVYYKKYSEIRYPGKSDSEYPHEKGAVAEVEVRRIENKSGDVPGLSVQANKVPRLSHRYYAGSIDKRRFAVTATAYNRNTGTLSSTWVQKGISLPAEQDKDIF